MAGGGKAVGRGDVVTVGAKTGGPGDGTDGEIDNVAVIGRVGVARTAKMGVADGKRRKGEVGCGKK